MKLLIGLLAASAALGAEFQPAPRIGIISQREVSLAEVIATVLANDKDIASSRLMRDEAGFNIAGASGVYDPKIGLNGHHLKQVSPVSSILGGSADGKVTTQEWNADPYVSGALPWTGMTYKLDFSSSRQTSDSTFQTLNPQYPTSLNLNLTQPLWRGLRYDDNRHRVQVAKKNQSLSDAQFRQKVIDVITQAVADYWDLDYALRDYQSQLDAVRLAGQQKESNTRQMRQGVLAAIDVVAAETQVATFEQQLYQAQDTLTRAENALKQLMAGGRSDVLWSTGLVPVTKVNTEYQAGLLEQEVTAALKNRPEVSQARISSEVNELDTRLYKDQTRPQVDLVALVSSAGLAGQLVPPGPNPLTGSFQPLIERLNALSTIAGLPPLTLSTGTSVPGLLVGGYGQSLNNLTSGVYPTVQVGVQMSLPLRNRAAKANLNVSVAEGKRLKNQQELVELAVVADVRNSAQALAAAQARFGAASRARDSAEEQYQSEQRQFKAGTSTLFLVLQRQTDMISARSRELRAQADVGRAIADLERATGATPRETESRTQVTMNLDRGGSWSVILYGQRVTIVPLVAAHAGDLWKGTEDPSLWEYLFDGPYADFPTFQTAIEQKSKGHDPLFFAILDQSSGKALGYASYMRIEPAHRCIEVGSILFSTVVQRTAAATEAMYLMARHVFEDLRYRRYEWKCNASNEPSRRAALRLGFTFEGIFRQHMIVKGKSRDTAWFAMLDSEWPARKAAFERWLDPTNFDSAGNQIRSLAEVR